MRNSSSNKSESLGSDGGGGSGSRRRNILDTFQRLADLNAPKLSGLTSSSSSSATAGPKSISSEGRRDESVGAKWEDLRHFEEGAVASSRAPDSSYGSLASSASSSSSSSSSSGGSAKERFLRMKKDGWRQLKCQLFGRRRRAYKNGSNVHYGEVSTSPDGLKATTPSGLSDPCKLGGSSASSSSLSLSKGVGKIRSTRSMQNLEQATRGSYLNLRDLTSEWRQRCHSRTELREGRPRSVYQALDDGDDDGHHDEYDDFRLRSIR